MAEYPEFSPKVREILRKARIEPYADVLISMLQRIVESVEKCDVTGLVHLGYEFRRFEDVISSSLDSAFNRGRISLSELTLAERELSTLKDKYIHGAAEKLRERCECRLKIK